MKPYRIHVPYCPELFEQQEIVRDALELMQASTVSKQVRTYVGAIREHFATPATGVDDLGHGLYLARMAAEKELFFRGQFSTIGAMLEAQARFEVGLQDTINALVMRKFDDMIVREDANTYQQKLA